MKKLNLLIIIFILTVLLCSCTQKNPDTEAVLTAQVMKIYDKSILISSAEDGKNPFDVYMIPSDLNLLGAENLQAGAIVEIGYNGMIMETYPAGLGEPKYIKFIEQKDDMVGFYETVFTKLWETDKGLNTDIDIAAFDLSNTNNLSDIEKNSLVYILGNVFNLETLTGTFEELCDAGYINKEKLEFENGILFKLETYEISDKKFKFNAEKWRSGLGAYFFDECTAKKTKNGWEYTIGAEMIS